MLIITFEMPRDYVNEVVTNVEHELREPRWGKPVFSRRKEETDVWTIKGTGKAWVGIFPDYLIEGKVTRLSILA